MPLITPQIKSLSEVTEPLKEQILIADVHTFEQIMPQLNPRFETMFNPDNIDLKAVGKRKLTANPSIEYAICAF